VSAHANIKVPKKHTKAKALLPSSPLLSSMVSNSDLMCSMEIKLQKLIMRVKEVGKKAASTEFKILF
jgi:hypothetical protein